MMAREELSSFLYPAHDAREEADLELSRVHNLRDATKSKLLEQSTRLGNSFANQERSNLNEYSRLHLEVSQLEKSRVTLFKEKEQVARDIYVAMKQIDDQKRNELEKIKVVEEAKIKAISLQAKELRFQKELNEAEQRKAMIDRGATVYRTPGDKMDVIDHEQNKFAK